MKNSRGFTLIELLVVIAIIGILSSVVLASLNSARAKARDSVRKSDLTQLRTALEAYYADNGTYPPEAPGWAGYGAGNCSGRAATLTGPTGYVPNLAPTYIPVLPVDPSFSNIPCSGYIYTSNGSSYTLLAHGLIESTLPSGHALHDPLRQFAWKICSGPVGCSEQY